jgi:hypothetical protein
MKTGNLALMSVNSGHTIHLNPNFPYSLGLANHSVFQEHNPLEWRGILVQGKLIWLSKRINHKEKDEHAM